jgi:hypothetical protein
MAIETLSGALRRINHLIATGVVGGLSDTRLFERFFAGAFEILVGRHDPGASRRAIALERTHDP